MDNKPKLTVDMLGVRFSLQADEDLAYLESLVSYYEGHVKDALSYAKLSGDSGKLKPESALKAAILAGVLTADRLYKEKKRSYILAGKIAELEKILAEKNSIGVPREKKEDPTEILVQDLMQDPQEDSSLLDSLVSELESVLKES